MGTENLPDLAAAPTKVDATTTQYNKITNALQGHKVMRETDGTPVDNTYDYGRPSSGRPRKLYLGTGLNVAGQDIDLASIALSTTGVSSGKSKASGYPNFLTPLGDTGGMTNTFIIEAATTNLEMTIDGEAYTLETDLESDDLTLAPSSNNTCVVGDSYLSTDMLLTKTIGEYGYWIELDDTGSTIGSEITSLDGTIQCFKIENTDTGVGVEVFIANIDISDNRLVPIMRGVGGTQRITFKDGDIITLLKAHYIFLDNDLVTIDTTTTHPTWGATTPTSPATGDYWWDVTNETWKRYSGSAWEALGRIYLGYAICDNADCLWVEHQHFNLAWNGLNYYTTLETVSDTQVKINSNLQVSVAGKLIQINNNRIIIDITTDLDSGETELPSTYYYIYIKNTGSIVLSTIIPRKADFMLGYYHPQEYYRCIGVIFNDTSSNILATVYNNQDGVFVFSDTGMPFQFNKTLGTGTGEYTLDSANLMPLTKKIILHLSTWSIAASTQGSIVFRRIGTPYAAGRIYGVYRTNYDTTAILEGDDSIEAPLIENCLIEGNMYNANLSSYMASIQYVKF